MYLGVEKGGGFTTLSAAPNDGMINELERVYSESYCGLIVILS